MAGKSTRRILGVSIGRICPLTRTSGKDKELASFGTPIDIVATEEQVDTDPNYRPAAESYEAQLNNGTITKTAKSIVTTETGTGAVVPTGDVVAGTKLKFLPENADILAIRAILSDTNTPIALMVGDGIDVDRNVLGYRYLLGYIEGDMDNPNNEGQNFYELTLKSAIFTAAGTFDHTAFNTAMGTSITPEGQSTALTPTAIDASDLTDMLSGKWADKAA